MFGWPMRGILKQLPTLGYRQRLVRRRIRRVRQHLGLETRGQLHRLIGTAGMDLEEELQEGLEDALSDRVGDAAAQIDLEPRARGDLPRDEPLPLRRRQRLPDSRRGQTEARRSRQRCRGRLLREGPGRKRWGSCEGREIDRDERHRLFVSSSQWITRWFERGRIDWKRFNWKRFNWKRFNWKRFNWKSGNHVRNSSSSSSRAINDERGWLRE